jgi:hypothetical protein
MLGVRPCIHTYSRPTFNIPDCSDWITFLCGFLWGKVLQNKDGCPIENVGHDGGGGFGVGCFGHRSFAGPALSAVEGAQDDNLAPMKTVGHDGGEGSG